MQFKPQCEYEILWTSFKTLKSVIFVLRTWVSLVKWDVLSNWLSVAEASGIVA